MSSMFSIIFFFRKGSSSILLRLKNDWRLNRFCSLLSWVPGVFSRDASRTAAGRHVKTLRLASLNVKAKGAILLIFLCVDSAACNARWYRLSYAIRGFLGSTHQGTCARWIFQALYHLHLTMYKRARTDKVVKLIINAKWNYFEEKILKNKDNTLNLWKLLKHT